MHKLSTKLLTVMAVLAFSQTAWAQPTDPFAPTPTTPTGEPQSATVDSSAMQSTGSATLPAGTWGIGTVGTVSGVRGAELEYHMAKLMVTGLVGLAIFAPDEGDTATAFAFGGGAFTVLPAGTTSACSSVAGPFSALPTAAKVRAA